MRARVPAFPNSAAKVHYFFEIAATFAGKLTITFDERHRASQRACHRVPVTVCPRCFCWNWARASRSSSGMMVEYAMYGMDSNLFVSKYELFLPNKEDLRKLVRNILVKK